MTAEAKIILAEAGATQVRVVTVHIPWDRLSKPATGCRFKSSGLTIAVHGLQFYLEHGARTYVITFSATSAAELLAVAHVVEATWHWQAK